MVQLFNLLPPLPPTPIPQLILHRKVEPLEKSYECPKAVAVQARIFPADIAAGSTLARLAFDLRKQAEPAAGCPPPSLGCGGFYGGKERCTIKKIGFKHSVASLQRKAVPTQRHCRHPVSPPPIAPWPRGQLLRRAGHTAPLRRPPLTRAAGAPAPLLSWGSEQVAPWGSGAGRGEGGRCSASREQRSSPLSRLK